jgi:hypothetical protein
LCSLFDLSHSLSLSPSSPAPSVPPVHKLVFPVPLRPSPSLPVSPSFCLSVCLSVALSEGVPMYKRVEASVVASVCTPVPTAVALFNKSVPCGCGVS